MEAFRMGTLGWEKGVGPGGKTLGATDQGAEVGAVDQGAELGATDQGAEPAATSAATSCHAGSADSHIGAKIHGAETCYLGAELRVHFPNSFRQASNCELLSQKGPTSKKVGKEDEKHVLCAPKGST
jgi:hypothetical protein